VSDADIDRALDACEHPEDAIASPADEEPSGSSGVPIPPPFAGPPHSAAPTILDDIDFTCRTILRRTAAWRAAVA
jgi:hypothetical protein